MPKKRNPADSTHRNTRAGLKRDRDLVKRHNALRAEFDDFVYETRLMFKTLRPDLRKR